MLGMLLQILLKSMRQNPHSQLPQCNRTLLTRLTLAKDKNANILLTIEILGVAQDFGIL